MVIELGQVFILLFGLAEFAAGLLVLGDELLVHRIERVELRDVSAHDGAEGRELFLVALKLLAGGYFLLLEALQEGIHLHLRNVEGIAQDIVLEVQFVGAGDVVVQLSAEHQQLVLHIGLLVAHVGAVVFVPDIVQRTAEAQGDDAEDDSGDRKVAGLRFFRFAGSPLEDRVKFFFHSACD